MESDGASRSEPSAICRYCRTERSGKVYVHGRLGDQDRLPLVTWDESLPVSMVIDQVCALAPVSSGGSRNLTFSSVTTRSLTSSTPSRWQ